MGGGRVRAMQRAGTRALRARVRTLGSVFSVMRNQQRALSRQDRCDFGSNRIVLGCCVQKRLLAARVEAGSPAGASMQGCSLNLRVAEAVGSRTSPKRTLTQQVTLGLSNERACLEQLAVSEHTDPEPGKRVA